MRSRQPRNAAEAALPPAVSTAGEPLTDRGRASRRTAGEPPDDMTLVIPLLAKDTTPLTDFCEYWLNAM